MTILEKIIKHLNQFDPRTIEGELKIKLKSPHINNYKNMIKLIDVPVTTGIKILINYSDFLDNGARHLGVIDTIYKPNGNKYLRFNKKLESETISSVTLKFSEVRLSPLASNFTTIKKPLDKMKNSLQKDNYFFSMANKEITQIRRKTDGKVLKLKSLMYFVDEWFLYTYQIIKITLTNDTFDFLLERITDFSVIETNEAVTNG